MLPAQEMYRIEQDEAMGEYLIYAASLQAKLFRLVAALRLWELETILPLDWNKVARGAPRTKSHL
ncbi:MAG TPA: hypothetical protein VLG16_03395 [Candidatus Saccharimonadales bacterium]|nr:hypothetical protein [Candidatus Saccharimonadales bacterium]